MTEFIRGDLRLDQWDLIVLALEHVVARCDEAQSVDNEKIHRLTRLVTKRRCQEAISHIQCQVPEAGKR